MELLAQVAGARVAPDAVDEYPAPIERPRIHVRTSTVNGCSAPSRRRRRARRARAARHRRRRRRRRRRRSSAVPTFASRPRARDRPRRGGRAPRRVRRHRPHRAREPRSGRRLTLRQRERRAVADALVGAGVSEAITISLVAPADLERSGAPVDRVVGPPTRSAPRSRCSAPGSSRDCCRAVAANHAHGLVDVALFEQGRVFAAPAEGGGPLPDEPEHVAVALSGARVGRRSRPTASATRTTRSTRCAWSPTRSASTTSRSSPTPYRGFAVDAPRARPRDGVDVGVVGELAPEVLSRGRAHGAGRRGRARSRRALRGPAS